MSSCPSRRDISCACCSASSASSINRALARTSARASSISAALAGDTSPEPIASKRASEPGRSPRRDRRGSSWSSVRAPNPGRPPRWTGRGRGRDRTAAAHVAALAATFRGSSTAAPPRADRRARAGSRSPGPSRLGRRHRRPSSPSRSGTRTCARVRVRRSRRWLRRVGAAPRGDLAFFGQQMRETAAGHPRPPGQPVSVSESGSLTRIVGFARGSPSSDQREAERVQRGDLGLAVA